MLCVVTIFVCWWYLRICKRIRSFILLFHFCRYFRSQKTCSWKNYWNLTNCAASNDGRRVHKQQVHFIKQQHDPQTKLNPKKNDKCTTKTSSVCKGLCWRFVNTYFQLAIDSFHSCFTSSSTSTPKTIAIVASTL